MALSLNRRDGVWHIREGSHVVVVRFLEEAADGGLVALPAVGVLGDHRSGLEGRRRASIVWLKVAWRGVRDSVVFLVCACRSRWVLLSFLLCAKAGWQRSFRLTAAAQRLCRFFVIGVELCLDWPANVCFGSRPFGGCCTCGRCRYDISRDKGSALEK